MGHVRRRQFLLAACALTASPLAISAQEPRRIVLFLGHVGAREGFLEALRAGLGENGWTGGHGVDIEVRWTTDDRAGTDAVAREIVASRPAVIVAAGGAAALPLRRVGATLPVVFAFSGDPVEGGLVKSYARPGGNFTGMTWMSLALVGKRLELLREFLPQLRRVAVFANPMHPGEAKEKAASETAAAALGLELRYYPTSTREDLTRAMQAAHGERCEALDIYPDGVMLRERVRLAEFAKAERIPAVSGWLEFAEAGFIASYGVNRTESIRRLASYVNRILRGAAPAELPVELPMVVEAAVNLKTARALGLKIPQTVLLRADRVIE